MKIIYLILAFVQPRGIQSFATYLLSRSNCWTELSTEEIIMNHRVVASEDSDDPQMHIKVIGDNPLPSGITFPTKVTLQVLTNNPKTNPDYQYVMEVNGTGASFVGGSCEDDRRIAGRAKEMVELVLNNAVPVTVWAGWAAGHEHVRLTPELIIRPPVPQEDGRIDIRKDKDLHSVPHTKEVPEGLGEQMETTDKEWYDELLNACSTIDWTSLESFAGRTIEHSQSAELYMDGTVEAPRVALRNVDYENLVIHCTDGAHVGTICPHMAVVSASDEWPGLHIEQERNISISGLYSLVGHSKTLYKTKVFELIWTPSSDDPSKGGEADNQDIKHTEVTREKEGFVSHGSDETDSKRINKEKQRYDETKKEEQREKMKNKIEVAEHFHGSHAQIPQDREAIKKKADGWKASTGSSTKKRTKPIATPEKPFDHIVVTSNEEESHENLSQSHPEFNISSHYYIGMAIMVGAGIIATQLCLISSRRNKGRRDL